MNNFDEIELKIVNTLNDISTQAFQEHWRGNKLWTDKIKEKIGNIGKELGYNVCTTPGFESEWLYDLVWYKNDSNGRLQTIPLTLESEWDFNWSGIKYDFEKLLLSNAEKRIMICQAKTKNEAGALFDNFEQSIKSYILGNINDRFLIIIYNEENGKFIPKLINRKQE